MKTEINNEHINTDKNNIYKLNSNIKDELLELELFDSNIPKGLTKEKKKSLLIVVLLQIIFGNDELKLNKIFHFLNIIFNI